MFGVLGLQGFRVSDGFRIEGFRFRGVEVLGL